MSELNSSPGFSIVSDPDTTSVAPAVQPEKEKELLDQVRILLVSDLDPENAVPDWAAGETIRRFDNADADAWLNELRPAIELSVENFLGGNAPRLTILFTADRLMAFSPTSLTSSIPALALTVATRDALADARSGKIGKAELEKRLIEAKMPPDDAQGLVRALTPGTPKPEADDALSRLLGMVDLGDNGSAPLPKSQTESMLDAFVGAVSTGSSSEVDRETSGRAIKDLTDRLNAQVDAILNAPEFRRLESAWRSLKFVLDRADFRGGMRVEVLAVGREHLAEALYHQVLMPEYNDGINRAPLAAIVVDQSFGHTPPEIESLTDLAETSGSLQIPIIASVDAAFFGYDAPTGLAKLGVLRQHLVTEAYIGYRKLRIRPDAQFLSLVVPPFVLRPPHEQGDWTESGILWGGGAILAAAALVESHKAYGWPTSLGDHRVSDLALRTMRMGSLPLSVSFSDRMMLDLAENGFFGFRAPLNRDFAVSGYPASTKQIQEESQVAETSLGASVFSALAAHRILRIEQDLAGQPPEVILAELEQRMRSFIGGSSDEEAVTIQHLEEHDTEEVHVFGIRLRPPRHILPNSVGLVLGANIPRTAP